MKNNTRDLVLLALCLSIFFAGSLISNEIPLLAVGLFFGLLSRKYRVYLFTIIITTTIATSFRSSIRIGYIISRSFDIRNIIIQYVDSNSTSPITVPVWITNLHLPNWLGWVGTIIIIITFVVLIVALIAILIPAILITLFFSLTWYTFLCFVKPIYFPEYTILQLIELVQTDEQQFISLLGHMLPWYLMYANIVVTISIPMLTYLFLKWIGFYKRIPKGLPP